MYTNACIQNLEGWYQRIELQGSNGETGKESRLMEKGGEGEAERHGKSNLETYISVCKIDSQWPFAIWLRKLKQGSVST